MFSLTLLNFQEKVTFVEIKHDFKWRDYNWSNFVMKTYLNEKALF